MRVRRCSSASRWRRPRSGSCLIRTLAEAIEGTLLDILDWVGDNQLWLTIASFILVFGWVLWSQPEQHRADRVRRGIAEELDEAAAEAAPTDVAEGDAVELARD